MIYKASRSILSILLPLIFLGTLINGKQYVAITGTSATVPGAQSPDTVFRFLALGDMGTGDDDQLAVARAMTALHQNQPFDTVLLLGDNVYPDGDPADLRKKFERPYAEMLKLLVNFYATLGNHDVKKGRNAQINYPLFNMGGQAYYSFVKGDGLIEFFSLDSTDADQEQMRWLDAALAKSKAKWKVAFFHHPIYSSGRTHGSDKRLRRLLEPLLVQYGVAAAFSGHDHTYERTKPQNGVQYFVSGTGGKLRKGDLDKRSQFFAMGDDQHNSFMVLEVSQTEFRYSAISSAGVVIDSGVIKSASAKSNAATEGGNLNFDEAHVRH